VWLVSAAPVELVQIIADALGLTGALGTVSEVQHGRWTGRLGSPILHGPAKAVAVGALAVERGIDLGASHSYSDSDNDRPLLEATGHPHAVNPDRALMRYAQHRGWPIHRHRRDLTAEAKAALVGLRARLLPTLARIHRRTVDGLAGGVVLLRSLCGYVEVAGRAGCLVLLSPVGPAGRRVVRPGAVGCWLRWSSAPRPSARASRSAGAGSAVGRSGRGARGW